MRRGVVLSSWGVDPATNSTSIGIVSDMATAQSVLPDVLGKDVPITLHGEGIAIT